LLLSQVIDMFCASNYFLSPITNNVLTFQDLLAIQTVYSVLTSFQL
jgi:hypothetical protein